MKDIPNNKNHNEKNTLIADPITNISGLNNIENEASIPNLSNKDNKKSRFPIAENNIIGFK